MLGSDYPFLMRSDNLVHDVRALRLPPEQENAILEGTLARLLKAT